MKGNWVVNILPCVVLLLVGFLVGSQFEMLWMRFVTGFPAGVAAYFLFRQWGKHICSGFGEIPYIDEVKKGR